jgi:4-hydroxy 2-oxovalerate aldolase
MLGEYMIANIKIFDCTLREVGYQTGWYFDKKAVRNIYRFAEARNIDYLELGFFHNTEADPNRGCFRYCSAENDKVKELLSYVKNRTKLSAMRDIQRPLSDILPKSESIVDTVRILTRSHETDKKILANHVEELQRLGYEVYINFTSAGNNSKELNTMFAKTAKELGISMIYFADTESIMTPEYIKQAIEICNETDIKIGLHLHDKNGTAEELAELAIACGVHGLDVTHFGLGGKWRDGNLTMEYLLKKFRISSGYENTVIRNELISQLIKYATNSAAE